MSAVKMFSALAPLVLAACKTGANAPVPLCDFTVTVVDAQGEEIAGATAEYSGGFGGGDCFEVECTVFSTDEDDGAELIVGADGYETVTLTDVACGENVVELNTSM